MQFFRKLQLWISEIVIKLMLYLCLIGDFLINYSEIKYFQQKSNFIMVTHLKDNSEERISYKLVVGYSLKKFISERQIITKLFTYAFLFN